MTSTVCLLRNGRGLDLDRYVERVFKTTDSAYKFALRQPRNVQIVKLPGVWRTGERVPLGVRGEHL
jgi:hypothetical protein